jgi:hypothetical protein
MIWFLEKSMSLTRSRALEEAQAGAIQQDRHEPRCAPQLTEESTHLVSARDYGQADCLLGPDHVVEPGQLLAEDVAVQEEERAQRLVLRGRRHVARGGQRARELAHLRRAHLGRMALAMEEDVAAGPRHIRLLGPPTVMTGADGLTNSVQWSRLPDHGRLCLSHGRRSFRFRLIGDEGRHFCHRWRSA